MKIELIANRILLRKSKHCQSLNEYINHNQKLALIKIKKKKIKNYFSNFLNFWKLLKF